MKHTSKSDLLAQMAQIQLMERGKLSAYTFKDRPAEAVYYKLQRWDQGKNATRYIPPEQVPLLQEALAGYARFQELTEQYTRLVIEETQQQLSAPDAKKKPQRRRFSSPKSKRSSN